MAEPVKTTPENIGGYFQSIVKAPFGGSDTINMDQARIVAVAYATAGAALGSVVGRQRQTAGKDPVLKVFF